MYAERMRETEPRRLPCSQGGVEISYDSGKSEPLGELVGRDAIAAECAFGAQGTVQPIEAGYYRPILRRVDGV
jgi:hypothetical protein